MSSGKIDPVRLMDDDYKGHQPRLPKPGTGNRDDIPGIECSAEHPHQNWDQDFFAVVKINAKCAACLPSR